MKPLRVQHNRGKRYPRIFHADRDRIPCPLAYLLLHYCMPLFAEKLSLWYSPNSPGASTTGSSNPCVDSLRISRRSRIHLALGSNDRKQHYQKFAKGSPGRFLEIRSGLPLVRLPQIYSLFFSAEPSI